MMGILLSGVYSSSDDVFVNCGYTNWKDASGKKKGGFPLHKQLHFYSDWTGILAHSYQDIAEMISTEHEKQKAVNRAYLKKVLQNVVFLARQGLSFRGN